MKKFLKLHLCDAGSEAVIAVDVVALVAPVRAHAKVFLRECESVVSIEVRESVAEIYKLLDAEAH